MAEVASQENEFLGGTIKAGGPIAGFIMVFLLSQRVLQKLRSVSESHIGLESLALKIPVNDKLPLATNKSCFSMRQRYECSYELYDTETGDSGKYPTEYTWEAGHLTVYVRKVSAKDRIVIIVEDKTGGGSWQSDHFDLLTHPTLVSPT
ncbi:MAG: hypothetical protein HY680_01940 [Chloroflexi bacterium]|nr:hypothetical protein [Chloroflexota bacterium]